MALELDQRARTTFNETPAKGVRESEKKYEKDIEGGWGGEGERGRGILGS